MKTVPLIGYSNRLSVRPGEKIEFKVSSKSKFDYTAELYRSINADPNPSVGGLVEEKCDNFFFVIYFNIPFGFSSNII